MAEIYTFVVNVCGEQVAWGKLDDPRLTFAEGWDADRVLAAAHLYGQEYIATLFPGEVPEGLNIAVGIAFYIAPPSTPFVDSDSPFRRSMSLARFWITS